MAINKRRDFKKLSVCIQEFLSKLPCDEGTGFLRDTLYLTLLELHKYYVREKDRLNSSLRHSNKTGTLSAALNVTTNHAFNLDKYERLWHGYDEDSNEAKSQGFSAAHQGDLATLKDIVQSDDADPFGHTYLMYTTHNKSADQVECMQYFLSLKFDINRQATDGSTALHVACQYDQKEAVVALLKNRADTTIQDNKGRAPLHWAAMNTSSDLTKLLLQYGANIHVKDCDSMTPVMWACHFNKPENLHVLKNALERLDPRPEAIFDDKDNDGRTVLHWAVSTDYKDDLQCLKDLLISDVYHVKDNQGRTVLHTAAKEGSVSACELILSVCGEKILNFKDNHNQTALHLATLYGHGETVDYLLRHGANIANENSNGRTALQEAEIGHYHYCLLVFAAFEQLKSCEKSKASGNIPQDKKNDTKTRKYESWVIPTGFLHDSQEIPDAVPSNDHNPEKPSVKDTTVFHTDTCDTPDEKQLVDVTEIKGFEVNEDLVSPDKTAQNIPTPNTRSQYQSKSSQNPSLQRSKRVEEESKDEEHPVDVATGQEPASFGDNEQLQEDELLEYSSQFLQQHGSALSAASSDSSEPGNDSISENIEVSSLGNDTDDDDDKSEQKPGNSGKDRTRKKFQEKNSSKSEESQVKTDSSAEVKNKILPVNSQDLKGRRGNLAPINHPLTQPNLGMPTKLDPIPLNLPNKKGLNSVVPQNGQPRGFAAPLLPPPPSGINQRDLSQPATLRDLKPLSDNSYMSYGTRGPGHGPLAHSHGKALLNNVFQDDSRKSEPKTPEMQRRGLHNNRPGKLPHPPRN